MSSARDKINDAYNSFPKTSTKWGSQAVQALKDLMLKHPSMTHKEYCVALWEASPNSRSKWAFDHKQVTNKIAELNKGNAIGTTSLTDSENYENILSDSDFDVTPSYMRVPAKRGPKDYDKLRAEALMDAFNANKVLMKRGLVDSSQLASKVSSPIIPSSSRIALALQDDSQVSDNEEPLLPCFPSTTMAHRETPTSFSPPAKRFCADTSQISVDLSRPESHIGLVPKENVVWLFDSAALWIKVPSFPGTEIQIGVLRTSVVVTLYITYDAQLQAAISNGDSRQVHTKSEMEQILVVEKWISEYSADLRSTKVMKFTLPSTIKHGSNPMKFVRTDSTGAVATFCYLPLAEQPQIARREVSLISDFQQEMMF